MLEYNKWIPWQETEYAHLLRSALAPGGGGLSWDSAPLVEQLTTEPGEHPKQEELEESVTAV